ncbi:MAG: hypothetical protein ACPGES_07085, partial [Coraliomargarita sp.]
MLQALRLQRLQVHRHLPAPEQPAVAVGQEALLVAAWEGLLVPVVAAWEGLLVPVACLQLLEQPEAVAVCSPKVPREPQAVPLAQVALPLLAERAARGGAVIVR